MGVTRAYEAAGEFLIMNGVNMDDLVPADKVRDLLTNFHGTNLWLVKAQFDQWWKDNITHAAQKDS